MRRLGPALGLLALLPSAAWAEPARPDEPASAEAGVPPAGPDAGPADAGPPDAAPARPRPEPIPAERLPTVSATIVPDEVELGAVATLALEVRARPGDRVHLKGASTLGRFEVRDRRREELAAPDGPTERLELDLQGFEAGAHEVPPVELAVVLADGRTGTVRSAPLVLRVTDPLANESAPEPRGDPPPRPVLTTERRILWSASVLAALIVAGLIGVAIGQVRQRRKPRPAPPPPPPRPPEEVALEKLGAIERSGMLDRSEVKEFHVGVSEAVREYLGGRYGFDSLELTTEELLAEVDQVVLRGIEREEVVAFLGETDMVKFAKWRPDPERSRALLASAYEIVRKTTRAELARRSATVRQEERTDGRA